jgi:UDP-3-O-[3-hydroxymyristoyl] N-acetylglucosamine deacetylase/3-hydroxyacyl-[acyl-carrier-protein] dehydratase
VIHARPFEADPAADAQGLELAYDLDYGTGNPIGRQSLTVALSPESFTAGLAPSRTFLLESEARALRQAGVGTRASEADLLIFGPEGPIGNSLRFPDECVRHKILDMVGDLALLGRDLVGRVVAHRSGHSLNAALVRALLEAENVGGDGPLVDGDGDPTGHGFDLAAVLETMPNRYPHLLLDRVVEFESGRRLAAVKEVRLSDPFFRGRRHGRPVMPGMMVLEALTQAAAVLTAEHVGRSKNVTVVAALDHVTIGEPVVPGDRLSLEVSGLALQSGRATVRGVASVGERFAAEARIQLVLADVDRTAA